MTVGPTAACSATLTNTAAGGDYAAVDTDVAVTVLPAVPIDALCVAEGDSGAATLTYTVTLSAASGRQVTVAYAEGPGGTATAGTDYTALAGGTLTFAAGDTSRTVAVAVTGDARDEPDETVVLTVSTPAGTRLASGTGTIVDDDDEPMVSIDAPSVSEGDTGAADLTFTVTLTPASGREVTVNYAEGTGGTARAGTDYTALAGGMLTFAAGDTSRTVTVAVTGDTVDEPTETVEVVLSRATNARLGTATGTGTITDDDAAPTVTLAVSPLAIAENGGTATVTATLSHASIAATTGTVANAQGAGTVRGALLTLTDDDDEPALWIDAPRVSEGDSGTVALEFTVTVNAASGKQVTVEYADAGTEGTDYTALADGTLTFAAGATTRTITVSVRGDALHEPNETVEVQLGSPINAKVSNRPGLGVEVEGPGGEPNLMIGTGLGRGTITDDDARPTVTLALSPASIAESGAGNVSTVTARLDRASSAATTVTVSAGQQTVAGDFKLSSARTLTIAAGETAGTGKVVLSEATKARLGTATGTGTITDDDGAPTVTLAAAPTSIAENGGTATVTATLSHASSAATTVTVTAGSGLYTVGSDATIAIAAGSMTDVADAATIVAVDDAIDAVTARRGTVTVAPTVTGRSGIAPPESRTLTIVDDDVPPPVSTDEDEESPAPPPAPGRGDDAPPVSNDGAPPAVPADLEPSFEARTVEDRAWRQDWAIDAFTLPAATGGNPPTRYDLQPALPAGVTREAFRVGGTPTVPLEATAYTWTATDAAAAALTFTLSGAAYVTVAIADASAAEGAALAFPVTFSAAAPADVTLTWTTESGSATPDADYTPVPAGDLTIAAGETTATIAVATTDDADAEPEETFTVRLAAAALPDGVRIETPAATGMIANDDTRVVVVVGTVVYVIDGRRVTVTGKPGIPDGVEIDLPTPLDGDVAVTVAPPAADVSLEHTRFGLGRQASRRTVVDVAARVVPAGGRGLCLPVRPGLRPEADGRGLALLHYGGNAWEPVAQSADLDGKVCAAGVAEFSPFAVGYERPVESGPNVGAVRGRALGMALAGVGRTVATDAVYVIGARFDRAAPPVQASLGGQTLPLHRAAEAGRWRRAAGVAYGVARALAWKSSRRWPADPLASVRRAARPGARSPVR